MSVVLIAMKLDDLLDIDWMLVFAPIWVVFLIMAVFCIFMFPGLTNAKISLHRFATLLILHNIYLLAFFIALLTKLIYSGTSSYTIFIPLYVAVFTQAVSLVWAKGTSYYSEIIFIVAVAATTILIPVKLEEDPYPWAVAMTPMWSLMAYWFSRMLYSTVKKKEQAPLLGNK